MDWTSACLKNCEEKRAVWQQLGLAMAGDCICTIPSSTLIPSNHRWPCIVYPPNKVGILCRPWTLNAQLLSDRRFCTFSAKRNLRMSHHQHNPWCQGLILQSAQFHACCFQESRIDPIESYCTDLGSQGGQVLPWIWPILALARWPVTA